MMKSPMSMPVSILVISSVGWGFTWLPLHYFSTTGFPSYLVIALAFGSAAFVLLPMLLREYQKWRLHIKWLLLIALFGGLANVSFQTAIYHGDVVRVMILFYLLPIWSVLGGRLFLHEKIDPLRWVTLICAIAGGYLILGGVSLFSQWPSWIDGLAILSGFAFAMNNIVFRKVPEAPLVSKVASMFLGVAVFIGAYVLFSDEPVVAPSASVGFWVVMYGVIWLTLITLGTQWGVTHMEAGRASIIIVLELVVAVVSSVIILDLSLGFIEISGALLVSVAAILEGGRDEEELLKGANGSES